MHALRREQVQGYRRPEPARLHSIFVAIAKSGFSPAPDAYGCYAWNSTAGRGKIALIKRCGGCGFADKTWFAGIRGNGSGDIQQQGAEQFSFPNVRDGLGEESTHRSCLTSSSVTATSASGPAAPSIDDKSWIYKSIFARPLGSRVEMLGSMQKTERRSSLIEHLHIQLTQPPHFQTDAAHR